MLSLSEVHPPIAAQPTWLLVLLALLGGGGALQTVLFFYRRWRYGTRDDAIQIAKAAQEQAESSAGLWDKYKIELEDAQRQMATYLDKIVEVNRELGSAFSRIGKVEKELYRAP